MNRIVLFGRMLIAGILLLFIFAGCASSVTLQPKGKDIDSALQQRNIPAALTTIQNPKLYKEKDRVLYYLDAGLLHHYNGEWAKSNELLTQAEESITELYTKSVSKAAASMLLNDNALDYAGEDYEDVYINVFKALNYLKLGNQEAAFVEIRRIDDKLSYLEQKNAKMAKELSGNPKNKVEIKSGANKFHSSALARYLSLALYESENKLDSARIDYDNIRFAFESQPEIYPFKIPYLHHPIDEQDKAPLLRVISMVNRGPYKRAKEMHIHTSKDLLLIGSVDKTIDVYPISWPDIKEGYYFKFSLPYLEDRPQRIGRVDLVMPDGKRYTLQKLEDVSRVARQTFKVKEPMIQLKSISRSVLKGLAAEAAKEEANKRSSGLGASLLSLAADAAVFLSENADLRMAQFFPSDVLMAEIPLAPGSYQIRLEYFSPQGMFLYSESQDIVQKANSLNLVQSWYF